MKRKRLAALLCAGIMAVNLLAPAGAPVVQAAEANAGQIADSGRIANTGQSEDAEPSGGAEQTEEAGQQENEEQIGNAGENIEDSSGKETTAEEPEKEEAAGSETSTSSENRLKEYRYTNPVYEGVGIEWNTDAYDVQTYDADAEDAEYTSDRQEIVKEFRRQMVARNEEFHLYYTCSELPSDDFWQQLFQDAVAHTGVGKEGDYLRLHCTGWQGGGTYEKNEDGSYNLDILCNVFYLTDADQEEQVDERVEDVLSIFQSYRLTDYQKIRYIHDYICRYVSYYHGDLEEGSYSLVYSAFSALIFNAAVCQGYATLFYRMALDAGLDARVITGDAGGAHAWNIVKARDKYYNIDTTWDSEGSLSQYYMKNMADFSDHVRDAEYSTEEFMKAYPMSERSYSSQVEKGQSGDYQYEVNYDGEVLITKYTGTEENVVTPATIDGKPVVGIGRLAFDGIKTLKTLTISEGVSYFGLPAIYNTRNLKELNLPSTLCLTMPKPPVYTGVNEPYSNCWGLEKITVPEDNPYICEEGGIVYTKDKTGVICCPAKAELGDMVLPETVTEINDDAFFGNRTLTSVQIPDGVTYIGFGAFYFCKNLKKMNIPRSLSDMLQDAFQGTALESIWIPKEVVGYIEGDRFGNDDSAETIKKIEVEEGNPAYKVVDGVLIWGNRLELYTGESGQSSYTVPDYITSMSGFAFYRAENLENITLNGKIKKITNQAFAKCKNLKEMEIPEGVESIEAEAFYACSNLKKVYLPKSLKKMGEKVFYQSSNLTDVYYAGSREEWEKIQKVDDPFEKLNVTLHFNYYDCKKSGHIFKSGICTKCGLVNGGKWIKSGTKWWYRYNDGYYPANKWCKIGGKWYLFDAAGWMQTGWQKVGGKWYYMNGSGAMQTGWQKISGKWYYMNGSGAMQTGWQKIGGKWYYMNGSGVMQTGRQKIGGKWYQFNASGVWIK